MVESAFPFDKQAVTHTFHQANLNIGNLLCHLPDQVFGEMSVPRSGDDQR